MCKVGLIFSILISPIFCHSVTTSSSLHESDNLITFFFFYTGQHIFFVHFSFSVCGGFAFKFSISLVCDSFSSLSTTQRSPSPFCHNFALFLFLGAFSFSIFLSPLCHMFIPLFFLVEFCIFLFLSPHSVTFLHFFFLVAF